MAGDSRSDIAIGAEQFGVGPNTNAGRTYVVYGVNSADPSDIPLADIHAGGGVDVQGFVITGEPGDLLGSSVGAAGDFNHDGRPDLIAGARFFDNGAGAAYVVYGAAGTGDAQDLDLPSEPLRWMQITGDNTSQLGSEQLGLGGVSGVADVNGDGFDDVIAASIVADPVVDQMQDGAAFVVYGANTPDPFDVLVTDIKDGGNDDGRGFMVFRNQNLDMGRLGVSVAHAGDTDGDGRSEFLVGDDDFDMTGAQAGNHEGVAYIVELPSTSSLSPGSHEFGLQEAGTQTASQTFTFTNTHTEAFLTVASVALAGTDPNQFAIVNDGCSGQLLMPSNDFCTVTARFSPSGVGSKQALLIVTSTADASPQTVGLTGTGIAQEPDTVIDGPQLTDANPIFTLSSPTAGATFECSLDLAPYSPCRSPVSFTGLAPGLHLLSARASAFGLTDSSPADHFFFVSAQEEVAPPEQGETANLVPISGKVLVDIPHDGLGFIPIEDAVQVPIRTKVDTRNGRVELTTETEDGGTQSADFYDGIFRIRQGKRDDLTVARLLGRQQCTPAAGAGSGRNALASRKRKPSLWGSGSGNFASSGNHGSASVRGTTWLIFEQCGGITGTFVKEGRVAFKNFYTGRTRLVRKGQTAFARPVGLRPR